MAIIGVGPVQTTMGRPLSSAEQQQVLQWINDAEMLIRVRLGDLAALDQTVLMFVVREAVVARLRNPEGYQSETVDDYTYRYPNDSRQVTITDEWWALLDPDASQAAGSIRPGFEPDLAQWPVRTPPYYDDREWRR